MGAEKALLALGDRPVIAHVVDRLRPQVDELFVNANGDPARFAWLGCAVVADPSEMQAVGPLAGLQAALDHAIRRGFARLATTPCDAPFLPRDLVARLDAAMTASGARAAVARSVHGLEPMFALWGASARSEIAAEFARGEASPRAVLERLDAAQVLFEAAGDGDPFANLNRPEDLAAALARRG
jgi:molybdopterin-guanine dinucleotide biosynthesis protein A